MKIDSIQLLRGVAALSVVAYHTRSLNSGSFGVDLFFVICGFIMMRVTENGHSHFLAKRLIRILPVYWEVTLVFALLHFLNPQTLTVLDNLFAQNHLVPIEVATQFSAMRVLESLAFVSRPELVIQGWTLACEVAFYALFFASACLSQKYRGLIVSLILLAFVAVGAVFHPSIGPLPYWTQPIMAEFIWGIVAHQILKCMRPAPTQVKRVLAGGIALVLLAGLFAGEQIFSPSYAEVTHLRLFLFGLPAFGIFLLTVYALASVRLPRFLVLPGNISYSLYLTHAGVMAVIYFLLPVGALSFVLSFALSVPVAYLNWWLVEHKLSGWLRRRFVD